LEINAEKLVFKPRKLFDVFLNLPHRFKWLPLEGGENSYQAYKPLREKVEALCKEELFSKDYSSASQLCNTIASRLEAEHSELLNSFPPYKNNYALSGND